jgi:hypothetical protein
LTRRRWNHFRRVIRRRRVRFTFEFFIQFTKHEVNYAMLDGVDHDDVVVVGHEHEHWNKDHWEHDADWDQYHHDHT